MQVRRWANRVKENTTNSNRENTFICFIPNQYEKEHSLNIFNYIKLIKLPLGGNTTKLMNLYIKKDLWSEMYVT